MLSLLFDSHFWYLMLIFGFVGVLVYLCFKYKQARLFISVLLGAGVLVLTGYSAIELNYYYTASGGVFGFIGEKLSTNQAVITDNYSYEIQNLMLTEDADGSYSATIVVNDIVDLDESKSYGVYVNGLPATQILQNSEYMQAEYHYQFFDDDAITILCEDSIRINLAFYAKSTTIKLSTEGKTNTLDGQSTVNYWNSYFNKNSFKIQVKESSFSAGDGFSEVVGDTTNFNIVNYYVDGSLYDTRVYRQGQAVELPTVEVEGKEITPWQYVNGDYYAYSYFSFPFQVDGNSVVKYLESDSEVVVPDSYSFVGESSVSYGEDILITTINNGCFENNITSITLGKNITSIEAGTFSECSNLKNVYVDSPAIYESLISGSACGGFFVNTGKVYILASIDDGSNTYLSNGSQITIGEKVYNVYTSGAIDIETTLEEVSDLFDKVGVYYTEILSCKLYTTNKVELLVKGYTSSEEEVTYNIKFVTTDSTVQTLTSLYDAREANAIYTVV